MLRLTRPLACRYKNSLAFDNIPLHKIVDEAFWAFAFKLMVVPAKTNTPARVYEYLLP